MYKDILAKLNEKFLRLKKLINSDLLDRSDRKAFSEQIEEVLNDILFYESLSRLSA